MVRIEKISKPKLIGLIKNSYQNDTDLFEKFHVVKGDAESLATETMTMIDNASKELDLSYYKVLINNMPIGYFVTSKQLLYSFSINPQFRKKDILIRWWTEVKKVLGKAFTTVLYENNTRAISFLEKQGMEVYKKDGNLVTLINYT